MKKKIILTTILLVLTFLAFLPKIKEIHSISKQIDKKIGQMLIISFEGNNANDKRLNKTIDYLENGEIGGVIFHRKNVGSKQEFKELTNKLIQSGTIKPFISIDNEGGYVYRYTYEKYKSAFEISKSTPKEAQIEYQRMAKLEKELNINLNFAPCVDLVTEEESIIAELKRSYGKNPEIVTKFAKIFINEHNKQKIATSLKHFPGHGSVKGDTHHGFVDSTKTFSREELEPYKNLKDFSKLNMVMVSHLYNATIDSEYPASLSQNTIKNILIKDVGFNGVIISDDYNMQAIRKKYKLRDIVVNSINSGVNILLFANTDNYKDATPRRIRNIIKKELLLGNIKMEDINNSYNKIIELKKHLW